MFSKTSRDTREQRERNRSEREERRRPSDAVTAWAVDTLPKQQISGFPQRSEPTSDSLDEIVPSTSSNKHAKRDTFKTDALERDSTLPKEVTQVMDIIRVNWDFMSTDKFNPVPHALALMDSSANGLDVKKFYAMHEKLEQSMDLIVNDYHQAFNDSIQTFSSVVENISESQKKVADMKSDLEWCKELLQCHKYDVFPLWVKSIQYKEMMFILETIETLQKVPDKVESLISGKYFYMAVTTLNSSLETLNFPEFRDIGALGNIRTHLEEIQDLTPNMQTLHEVLIDELNNHIYLKSTHSLDRIGVKLDNLDSENDISSKIVQTGESYQSLDNLEKSENKFMENLDENPERDSFKYMKVILECLNLLDRLPEAVGILWDRLSVEFYYTVERTIQETDQLKGRIPTQGKHYNNDSYAQDLVGLSDRLEDAYVLRDLLSNLFQKLETIIVGHDYVLRIIRGKVRDLIS
ncbi:hypothetical protein HK100_012723 [Physocladia obscura]|uniref:Exocyst complex component Sec8 n=1 Tax=Physocladia obscura TaxID=109957 RepID=A0AAD5SZD8_9FUNG|nr:hypothetical protein HK100_012723 [Physocladia obscura]